MRYLCVLMLATLALCPLGSVAKADFINGDFETGDLTGLSLIHI